MPEMKQGCKVVERVGFDGETLYRSAWAIPPAWYKIGKWTLPGPGDGGLAVFVDLPSAISYAMKLREAMEEVAFSIMECDYIPARFQVFSMGRLGKYWFADGLYMMNDAGCRGNPFPPGTAVADAVRPNLVVKDVY